jgi:hypothetical protein
LQIADTQLDSAASRIAASGAQSPDGANLDVVDLSAAMIALDVGEEPGFGESGYFEDGR